MAAALIGEALISASIEVLCDRVTSAEFIDLFRQKKLDEPLLMNLKTTLLISFAVLNDAEEKEIVNPAVREWLNELKHAVFDAEDLLDEIDTEALRCKLEGTDQIFSHVALLKSQGYENMFFLGKKLATCSELAIQSVMNLRSKAPVRKLVEVATGMIDGEMDAISYCSLFSKFLLANARNGVF